MTKRSDRQIAYDRAYGKRRYAELKHSEEYVIANRKRAREWYYASKKNKKRVADRNKRRAITHKVQLRDYARNYMRKRLNGDDLNFRIRHAIRRRIYMALVSNAKKSDTTRNLLGCTIENLWLYLESKFEPGMTRENYGSVWHVDHIMPCAIFDLTKPEHQKRCFHFSNLQPLFAAENQAKFTKVTTNQFNLL